MTKWCSLLMLLFLSVFSLKVSHEGQYAWYTYEEKLGKKCLNAVQCDGQRRCTATGQCTGVARPAKRSTYEYDESATNSKCPFLSTNRDYKNRHFYCDGARTCSPLGWCEGTAR